MAKFSPYLEKKIEYYEAMLDDYEEKCIVKNCNQIAVTEEVLCKQHGRSLSRYRNKIYRYGNARPEKLTAEVLEALNIHAEMPKRGRPRVFTEEEQRIKQLKNVRMWQENNKEKYKKLQRKSYLKRKNKYENNA